jgi:hypothetical protein
MAILNSDLESFNFKKRQIAVLFAVGRSGNLPRMIEVHPQDRKTGPPWFDDLDIRANTHESIDRC